MDPGYKSNVSLRRLEGLVRRGLLRPLTAAEEWHLPGEEDEPPPAHQFFRGLLDYYQVELQHLTPNGI